MAKVIQKHFNFLNEVPLFGGGVDSIELNTKIKILRGISFILFVTSGISVLMRLTILKTPLANQTTIIAFTLFFLVFHLLFRRIKTIGAITHTFMISYFLMVTVRMIQGGGIISPNVTVYILFCICAFLLYGRSWGIGSIITCLTISTTVFILQLNFPELLPDPDSTLLARGILILLAFFYTTFPLKYLFDERRALVRALRKYEKIHAANVITRRINHEVGNSLQIAMGEVEWAKQRNKEPDLEKIAAKLHEMDDLMKFISKMADAQNLVDFLKENEDEIKIMHLDPAGKESPINKSLH